ncbi:MAG: aminodeoxyfutalosine deaminase [Chthoniobacter sp.]|jgi:cytosine/adenosine deaminase-related metal-dependent hydrolase|nr:aminodeoxyfutalosine deaminase [Chthoniobacter sp.]
MIIRARTIVTMAGPPLENGAVAVDGNRIVGVGSSAEVAPVAHGPVIDLGERVLMPGLINAHCHLDYTMMRHAIDPPKSFTAWVQRINALKRSLDNDDYLAAIERGFAELRRWGTTAVGNIEAFPELMLKLAPSPIRTWWFYEMIDIRHRITTHDVVGGALAFFEHRANALDSFGLAPHAPYTASVSLYQLANECASGFTMPLTTHVAESRDEFEMFHDASGPLYEFMASLKRPMDDCGRQTPFGRLWESGAINGHWLLAHMNELTEEDFQALASLPRGDGPSVVHCPGSHRYFGHAPFQYRRLHDLGINICVGTDSLASTESLSLLAELRTLFADQPWLTPEQLLRTVTVNPARALDQRGTLGQIVVGALADLIALPVAGTVGDVHEAIVHHAAPIPWMMIDGQPPS